jgi:hypothetical protein
MRKLSLSRRPLRFILILLVPDTCHKSKFKVQMLIMNLSSGNTLFLTILVSMLSTTFSTIVANATAEIQVRLPLMINCYPFVQEPIK